MEAMLEVHSLPWLRPQEGISTIITAISRSRMIFRRLETYIIYRIASSLLILGFFFFAIVILEFEIPTWVLVRPPCRSLPCRQHVQYVLELGDCACAPDVASMWRYIPVKVCSSACSYRQVQLRRPVWMLDAPNLT